MNKKDLTVAVLTTFILTVTLFSVLPTRSAPGSAPGYDFWADINGDGKINMYDISYTAQRFGATGEPINKTALVQEIDTARAHNETYSTTLETRSGYDWGWKDMPNMTVQITLKTTSTLLIMFSAEATTGTNYLEIYVRAMVDSTPANPPEGVTLTKLLDWASFSFTFYKPNVTPETHTVTIQWSYNDEVGSVQVNGRSMIVTSLLG